MTPTLESLPNLGCSNVTPATPATPATQTPGIGLTLGLSGLVWPLWDILGWLCKVMINNKRSLAKPETTALVSHTYVCSSGADSPHFLRTACRVALDHLCML